MIEVASSRTEQNLPPCYEDFIAVGEDLSRAISPGNRRHLLLVEDQMVLLMSGDDVCLALICFGLSIVLCLFYMKRFHTLLAGASWMAEYGDQTVQTGDRCFYCYSPYHLIDEKNEIILCL
jgi:prolyl oligopeptidase